MEAARACGRNLPLARSAVVTRRHLRLPLCLLCLAFVPTGCAMVRGQEADANILSEARYVDSPEIARDRDWLVNYLTEGKSVEQSENIRDQVSHMKPAHVRSLLRVYQQKQSLVKERESAVANIQSPILAPYVWPLPDGSVSALYPEETYDRVLRQLPLQWNPYMLIPFNPLPLDITLVDDPIPY